MLNVPVALCAGSDDGSLVLLDVREAIYDSASQLEELGAFPDPAPTLKGPGAELPPGRQLALVTSVGRSFVIS